MKAEWQVPALPILLAGVAVWALFFAAGFFIARLIMGAGQLIFSWF